MNPQPSTQDNEFSTNRPCSEITVEIIHQLEPLAKIIKTDIEHLEQTRQFDRVENPSEIRDLWIPKIKAGYLTLQSVIDIYSDEAVVQSIVDEKECEGVFRQIHTDLGSSHPISASVDSFIDHCIDQPGISPELDPTLEEMRSTGKQIDSLIRHLDLRYHSDVSSELWMYHQQWRAIFNNYKLQVQQPITVIQISLDKLQRSEQFRAEYGSILRIKRFCADVLSVFDWYIDKIVLLRTISNDYYTSLLPSLRADLKGPSGLASGYLGFFCDDFNARPDKLSEFEPDILAMLAASKELNRLVGNNRILPTDTTI